MKDLKEHAINLVQSLLRKGLAEQHPELHELEVTVTKMQKANGATTPADEFKAKFDEIFQDAPWNKVRENPRQVLFQIFVVKLDRSKGASRFDNNIRFLKQRGYQYFSPSKCWVGTSPVSPTNPGAEIQSFTFWMRV